MNTLTPPRHQLTPPRHQPKRQPPDKHNRNWLPRKLDIVCDLTVVDTMFIGLFYSRGRYLTWILLAVTATTSTPDHPLETSIACVTFYLWKTSMLLREGMRP